MSLTGKAFEVWFKAGLSVAEGERTGKWRRWLEEDWILILTVLRLMGEFPGGPVVRTPRFHCRGHGFDPWSGN